MDSLKATMGLDATDYARTLARTEKQAAVAGHRIANNLAGPTISAARGKGLGGGASAMFISVARDSAASLASGANPFTVLMQQGPQVLQAFTMMGAGLRGLIAAALPLSAALVSLTNVVMLAKTANEAKKAEDEAEIDEMGAAVVSRGMGSRAITGLNEEVRRGRISREEADQYIDDIVKAGQGSDPTKYNQEKNDAARAAILRLRQIRQDDPTKQEQKHLDELDKLSQKMFVNTMTGIERERLEARLAYDERKAQIADLAAKGGTNQTNTAYRLAEDEYAIRLRQIDERHQKPPAAGLRFGSRMELPPGQLELQNNVRDIARNVRDIATKPTPPSEGVKF